MTLKRFFILMTLTLLWALPYHAQSVEVRALITLNNGEEQLYTLSQDDQLAFEGQETLLIILQGSTYRINIDDIRKIEFVDITGTEETHTGAPLFYPNPVERYFALGNIENDQTVSVYSLEGRMLYQTQANPNEPIDLDKLAPGLYILNVNGHNQKLLKR